MTVRLPITQELKRAYDCLQHRPRQVRIEELALWIAWSRLDARLLQILIRFIGENFQNVNPILLRIELRQLHAEAVGCVLADWVDTNSTDFQAWALALQYEVQPVPFQSFFVGIRPQRPEEMRAEAARSLKPFKRWGFYSSEDPRSRKVSAGTTPEKTLMGPLERKQVLKELLKQKRSITVDDYIEALGHAIHRRQAERDLKADPKLKPTGQTRARRYRL